MEEQKKPDTADSIIQSHVIYSMTAGAIPIPLVDFVAISAIQLDLLHELARHHNADFDANLGKSLLSSLVGTSLAKIGASAIKAIPGIGTAMGIGAQIVLAGGTTYALGRVFDSHFAGGGTLAAFSVEAMRQAYEDLLAKGKDVAHKLRSDDKKEDILATIEKLSELRRSGAISDDDFETTKKKLLDKLAS